MKREKEIKMMIEILSRYSRPNVMITGDASVGKTAVVDGLTCNIVAGSVLITSKILQFSNLTWERLVMEPHM